LDLKQGKEKAMRRGAAALLAVTMVAMATWCCLAADVKPAPQPAAQAGPAVTVLETYSAWRTFVVLKPPVIQFADGPKPVTVSLDWVNRETPPVAADWAKPEFADTSWTRGSTGAYARTAYLAKLYLRSHFEVADPAKVKDLKLTIGYIGGAIVYVNGVEVARGNLAKTGAADLAEPYPPEAFVTDDGKITPPGWQMERYPKQQALRNRTLADVAVPAKMLRKGVNVLALEIVRTPYDKIVDEKKSDPTNKDIVARGTPYDLSWDTCDMRAVKLTAAADDGVSVNAGRPEKLQVWNGEILSNDYDTDVGDRCEPLRPLTIKGAINGWFSGKVCVGSPKALEGLKATMSDLKGGVTIPASAVRVRYASSWSGSATDNYNYVVPQGSALLDTLLEAPLETFPARSRGITVPIWVTVKVPADAKPGTYTGQLSIVAKDQTPITVPVKLEVADFVLPNQEDGRAWVELIQSPDTLAMEYGVPLWSDKHWELMAQSMRYIGEMGTRTAYVPLICRTNFGNAEAMVRWIKKADGTFEYDFSIMDKYLDMVQKNMGTPKFVAFTAWDSYLLPPPTEAKVTESKDPWLLAETGAMAARWNLRDKGPVVTVLDPATGQTAALNLPRFDNPAAKALWQPLFDELHKRMAKRGLEDKMMLGMCSDACPTKAELTVLQEVSGNLTWVNHTHSGPIPMNGLAKVKYVTFVWNNKFAPDPAKGHTYGWKRPDLATQFIRFAALNDWPLVTIEHFEELNITGEQRGVGRIGADFWPAIKDAKGRRAGHVVDRYPESYWHSLNLSSHLLAPGPTGPVATVRYEAYRQGVQECEARIAIEQVLTDEALKAKIGPELAQKSQAVLDDRLREMWRADSDMELTGGRYVSRGDDFFYGGVAGQYWFIGSGWQDRTQSFFELAGEVARKAQGK
jgi:hypothetical protein